MRNAQRQPLRDGGFADTGFADQARVVFGAAAKDLLHPVDFAIPPDDGIHLPRPRFGGQVGAISQQGFALFIPLLFAAGFGGSGRFTLPLFRFLRIIGFVAAENLLQKRKSGGAAGGKPVFVVLAVTVHIAHHQLHLLIHLLDVVLRHPEFIQHLLHRFDAQLPRTGQAQTVVDRLVSLHTGNKHHSGSFFAS